MLSSCKADPPQRGDINGTLARRKPRPRPMANCLRAAFCRARAAATAQGRPRLRHGVDRGRGSRGRARRSEAPRAPALNTKFPIDGEISHALQARVNPLNAAGHHWFLGGALVFTPAVHNANPRRGAHREQSALARARRSDVRAA